MKRLLSLGTLFVLAVFSVAFAQSSGRGTFRTPSGEHPITYVEQSGQTYVSAAEAAAALGGTLATDNLGYRMTIGDAVAAFATDSRYAVVRDDLIEMPVPPIVIEGQPYVPWQFLEGFLSRAASLDVEWNPDSRVLAVRPQERDVVGVQLSLANVQGLSKIVLTLAQPVEYTVVKGTGVYVVRFSSPIRPPFAEQTYDDAYVSRLAFGRNELRIQLTGPDVVGDAYDLQNPPRIVLDFRKGAPAAPPGAPPPPSFMPPAEAPGIRTIVIDPGHGGKEVGAVGPNGAMEKDITLVIARKLASALASRTGARVVLTRDDDSLVSLDQRTALANHYKADLFLSVHLNAAVVKDAKGSETYFLSLEASDELARKAAETENAADRSASSDLDLILWDLAQQAYLGESSRFAQAIQEEMNAATAVANRGVKQAPFKVLLGATMPAALVEVGFISNAEEEKKLQSDEFQNLMVDALTRAVQRYKKDYETRIGLIKPEAPASTPAPAAGAAAPSATAPAAERSGTGRS